MLDSGRSTQSTHVLDTPNRRATHVFHEHYAFVPIPSTPFREVWVHQWIMPPPKPSILNGKYRVKSPLRNYPAIYPPPA
jgi:hypothetical protein